MSTAVPSMWWEFLHSLGRLVILILGVRDDKILHLGLCRGVQTELIIGVVLYADPAPFSGAPVTG
jgi:hypothetical protein